MSHRYPEPLSAFADVGDPTGDNQVYVSTGVGTLALESGATLRTSLGLAIGTDVQAWDAQLDDIAALAVTDGNIIVGDGSNWVVESGATARTSLGLAIGTDVQAWDAQLDDIAALAVTDGNIIVGDGANWVVESGATARTSLGLGTGDSPTFSAITISNNATINGDLTVKGVTTTLQTEVVEIHDNYLELNKGYTADAAQSGGIAVRYDPTTTSSAVAGAAFTATTVEVASGTGFGAGDIIAIDNPADPNNSGIYEVQSVATNTITIDTTPQEDFSGTTLAADSTVQGTVTKVAVAVFRASTSGVWQTAAGSTVPLSYSQIDSGLTSSNNTWTGTQDFQDAITTDAVKRNVRLISTTVSALGSDHIVVQNAGTSPTYTLPAATGSGREIIVKKDTATGSGNLTVDGNGADTIDGASTVVLKHLHESVTLIDYDTGKWSVH